MNNDTVYVVLLNWNGWRDTLPCLETLFSSSHRPLKVIVCDNASADHSMEAITNWARGYQTTELPFHPRLRALLPAMAAPVAFQFLTREEVENQPIRVDTPLTLIDNGANLGFAAGNNVGIRLALSQADMRHVWLLNNDTLVEPDCLKNMLMRLEQHDGPAVCGSMIHFYDNPEIIQAIGGNNFNRRTGCATRSLGRFMPESQVANIRDIEAKLDYLSGCSMLLPREFLETIGLMNEDYFLYYEEIDWFTRAAGRFDLCIAENARLYHREGSAIGSAGWQRPASPLSDFHMFRSQLIFMRSYHRENLPFCYGHIAKQLLKRAFRGQLKNVRAVLAALLGTPAPVVT